MLAKLLPWKFLMQRAAHHYGFVDPVSFLARIRKFSQPSEVAEPIELLRAGVSFHARGLINTKAIQTNLDWVWPYWVEKQFKPGDPSFVARAFSFSHVNLTHRDWSAVGLPNLALYPIVDPRGLVTPLFDGWSLDFWLQLPDGELRFPSRASTFQQKLDIEQDLQVSSEFNCEDGSLIAKTRMTRNHNHKPELAIELQGKIPHGGTMYISARPYNPEGIQFVERIEINDSRQEFTVNKDTSFRVDQPADSAFLSNYRNGDVSSDIERGYSTCEQYVHCDAGMATAAFGFDIDARQGTRTIHLALDLTREMSRECPQGDTRTGWHDVLAEAASLQVPNPRMKELFDINLKTLTLLSAGAVVPGPYTYKRFWFRDACLMMNALLATNLSDRVGRALPGFLVQQKQNGYFQSQEGEWDSNGQVLWIMNRFEQLTGERLSDAVVTGARKAVKWIGNKVEHAPESNHHGLLPAGFSAEHFGPNDHYYWDDFWAIGGLKGASELFQRHNLVADKEHADRLRQSLELAVQHSISNIAPHRRGGGIPASPYRRMDSGAIGSMVLDYPLQLCQADDREMSATANFLMDKCFYQGAFFQDMIHSGKNIYLTLAIAQTLLRQGDSRYLQLLENVIAAASPTGHWPEAIHPSSGGGCMGDGQHGWAAAEFLMMIRNLFVREECDRLVIGSGLPLHWVCQSEAVFFGPTKTPWGDVTVNIDGPEKQRKIYLHTQWHAGAKPPKLEVAIPGYQPFFYREQEDSTNLTPLETRVEKSELV